MTVIMKIWACLTGGKLVWLQDNDGEVTLAIARTNPFGGMMAERYWPFHIRTVQLNDDGTANGYINQWKFYR
jgi:hypothetical protein